MLGADNTWIAIAAALIMGLSGVCLFVFAVKRDYFRDFEDAKYQVFWNDLGEMVDASALNSTKEQTIKHDGPTPPER